MDYKDALRIYISGFTTNSDEATTNRVIENIYMILNSEIEACCIQAKKFALIVDLFNLSPYWKTLKTDDIIDEIERFTNLIINNPNAIEEYRDIANLLRDNFSFSISKNMQFMPYFMAHKIACGCFGMDHLYSDMGFADRKSVSEIINTYFEPLASKNPESKMKWKKFLYKQLCEKQNIPSCPAPSCQQCTDYKQCFIDSE